MAIQFDGDVRSLETKVLFEIRHQHSNHLLAAVTSMPAAQRLVKTVYKGLSVKVKMAPINTQNRAVWQDTIQRMKRWEE